MVNVKLWLLFVYNHYNFGKLNQETEYESKGFVKNSFMHGLSPEETWFHAITGREGVTDTSMKTSRTGYIQRKLIKSGEDHQVQYDHSVRTSDGSVIQFVYGGDGLDGSETIVMKGKPAICNMSRIVDKYNLVHERHTRCSIKWKTLAQKLLVVPVKSLSSSSYEESDSEGSSEESESKVSSSEESGEGSSEESGEGSSEESGEGSSEESGEGSSEESGEGSSEESESKGITEEDEETDLDISEDDDWDDEVGEDV